METENEFNRKFKKLKCQLKRQKAAFEELALVADQCAKGILRHDQAISLDILKAKIMKEVEAARRAELIAGNEFSKRRLTNATMNLVGILSSAVTGRGNPLHGDTGLFRADIDWQAPFDTVLVAIDKKGLPEGATVVPLFCLARQSNRSEAVIRESLAERGCLLMSPQIFAALVDSLKRKVLNGAVSLPVSVVEIDNEIPEIIRSLK